MKKTLLYSIALMMLLNAWQFFSSYQQRMAATGPWKLADISALNPATAKQTAAHTTVPQPTTSTQSDSASAAAELLVRAKLRPEFAALYLGVQAKTGTPWQLLAAIHHYETTQSGDTSRTSPHGATGPMQFMPATFRAYGLDGDGDGVARITDLEDAMLSAGHYLATNGASKHSYRAAVYQYNHSWTYVDQVLRLASSLGLH